MRKNVWDRMAGSYDKRFRGMYAPIFEAVISAIGSDDEVVEIGCGTGLVSFEIIPRVKRFVGADLSSAMIAVATEKLVNSGHANAMFITGDAMAMPEIGKFDKVLIVNLLQVVDDPAGILSRARALVKEGGEIVVISYCHGERMGARYRFLSRFMKLASSLGLMERLNRFTFEGLERIVQQEGYGIIEERRVQGGFPFLFLRLANQATSMAETEAAIDKSGDQELELEKKT